MQSAVFTDYCVGISRPIEIRHRGARLPFAAGERGWNNGRSIVQSNPDQKRTAVRECQPSILHHSQGEAH